MTTRQRIARLAQVLKKFPALGGSGGKDLMHWLKLELGAVDALDAWQKRGGQLTRAVAPGTIYHILAGNLDVSGQHSLLCGLLLGSQNILKLPSDGGEGIVRFAQSLPAPLRALVAWRKEFDPEAMSLADAVIAYGSDETISKIRAQTRWDQIFLGYGSQASVIWLGKVKRVTPKLVAAVAHDVCLYDQMGCLSPQAVYLEPGSATEEFCAALAVAMKAEIARLPRIVRSAGELGVISGTIDTARALGHRVWPVDAGKIAGAVILDPQTAFQFSCLHRVIVVREVKLAQLPAALDLIRGKISAVGLASKPSVAEQRAFLDLGVKRFCPVGRMQHPPLWWHHDGRPSISDLVRWIDDEIT